MGRQELILLGMEDVQGPEVLDSQIKFEGFKSLEHQQFVAKNISLIGLPTDRIKIIRFIGADDYIDAKREWFKIGHFARRNGEYALYKAWGEKVPPIGQLRTMAHELAHANSPLYEENDDLFGGRDNRERAASHAEKIARQSLRTNVYLDPYHKKLAEMLKEGQIDETRFIEETHAIMTELRFTNLGHLRQVEESQRRKLRHQNKEAVNIVEGIDQTLIDLISRNKKEVKNPVDLEAHINQVRQSFIATKPALPKAA